MKYLKLVDTPDEFTKGNVKSVQLANNSKDILFHTPVKQIRLSATGGGSLL